MTMAQISPTPAPKSRKWVFTTNNYSEEQYSTITSFLESDKIVYAVVGKEVGASGTPHLQGYLRYNAATTRRFISKNIPESFIEAAVGDDVQNRVYCSKDGDFEEFGTFKKSQQGQRTDLDKIRDKLLNGADIKQISMEHFGDFCRYGRAFKEFKLLHAQPYEHTDVRGVWIWGHPGTGKSHCVRQYTEGLNLSMYDKPQNKWFDGYAGEELILIDDLDTGVLGHHLKRWADKYGCTGETKGGTVPLQHKYFVITSNYPPAHFWPDDDVMCAAIERRFIVQEKRNKNQIMNFDDREADRINPVFARAMENKRKREERENGENDEVEPPKKKEAIRKNPYLAYASTGRDPTALAEGFKPLPPRQQRQGAPTKR